MRNFKIGWKLWPYGKKMFRSRIFRASSLYPAHLAFNDSLEGKCWSCLLQNGDGRHKLINYNCMVAIFEKKSLKTIVKTSRNFRVALAIGYKLTHQNVWLLCMGQVHELRKSRIQYKITGKQQRELYRKQNGSSLYNSQDLAHCFQVFEWYGSRLYSYFDSFMFSIMWSSATC